VKPTGDDILTPTLVANANFGCNCTVGAHAQAPPCPCVEDLDFNDPPSKEADWSLAASDLGQRTDTALNGVHENRWRTRLRQVTVASGTHRAHPLVWKTRAGEGNNRHLRSL
jgi:hypothetical protein